MNNQLNNKNNEKSSMTYEKLMNSHFLKYPTSNPVVYAIFNPFMTALISFVAITAYVKIVDGDWMMALITALVASAFMQMKMSLMFMNVDGHGVGISKRGKLSVIGGDEMETWWECGGQQSIIGFIGDIESAWVRSGQQVFHVSIAINKQFIETDEIIDIRSTQTYIQKRTGPV